MKYVQLVTSMLIAGWIFGMPLPNTVSSEPKKKSLTVSQAQKGNQQVSLNKIPLFRPPLVGRPKTRLVGGGSFTLLLDDVEFQPFTANTDDTGGGSTKINITDDTGTLASGVEAIRFDVLDTVSNDGGGAVFSEIDVFGTATVPEPSALMVLSITGMVGTIAHRRRRRASR